MAVVGEPQKDHAVMAVARGEHFVSEIFVVGDKDRSPLDSQVEYAVIIGASLKIEYGNPVVSQATEEASDRRTSTLVDDKTHDEKLPGS